ncbi:MAG: FAD-dependent oxidoreductase [Proteobacteria bacterium]|nr:FAD-dependent oxidoreductase [Pseudomonadota bacterium]
MSRLFSPCRIGSLELKNRIVVPAMHLGYAENGLVNDKLIRFYQERARGGAGLIIVGGAHVHPLGIGGLHFMAIDDDSYIPGLKALNDAMQEGGAKTSIQLFHAGRYAYSLLTGEQPVSASEVPYRASGDTPRALSVEEIRGIVVYFKEAARRAKEACYDSVEISGATGYLVSQFLSPFTNQRTDEYGGSFQKRLRFAQEIIQAIKQELGQDYPIIFRLSFADYVKGGNTITEAAKIAKELEQAGADALDMQVGWHESRVPTIDMMVPQGAFAYLSKEVKREVTIPVMVTNRITDPTMAEEFLQDGTTDLICMGRPLIADPELPEKVREGRLKEIRPCIACNQGCFDSVLKGAPVACMVNPMAGREDELEIKPAESSKKVLVVGSGPGGLEAARILSLRGHEVTVYEQQDRLGGQLNLCMVPPGRQEFRLYLDYLTNELQRLNVRIVSGAEVTEETVKELSPDVIVLATGSEKIIPPIPGIELPHVYDAESVLEGKGDLGEKTVIIGGGAVGCETALYVAEKGTMTPDTAFFLMENGVMDFEEVLKHAHLGRNVTIVEMLDRIGADFGGSHRWVNKQNLNRRNITQMPKSQCLEINEEGVVVSHDGAKKTVEADTVVIAAGYSSRNALYSQLEGKVGKLVMIGDANQPRTCLEAVYEGTKAGRDI